MCAPATLALAAAGVSMLGQGFSALQANQQAKYQARIAERNAALEREAGLEEEKATQDAARAHYRKVAALKGRQRLAAAANGVSVEFGTAADVLADTDMLAREDARRILDDGFNRRKSRDIRASNYKGEANAARSRGKNALIGGLFNMGSTALGGAQQFSALRGPKPPKQTSFG